MRRWTVDFVLFTTLLPSATSFTSTHFTFNRCYQARPLLFRRSKQGNYGLAGENTLYTVSNNDLVNRTLAKLENKEDDINCARGVCSRRTHENHETETASRTLEQSQFEWILSSYLGPRIVLASAACLYGTNFALGELMNEALPASAATSARMVLASLALSPFVFKLKPSLIVPSIFCGLFTSLGYIAQSLALVDTSPATVSFLGAATVLVCPLLECLVDKKPMGIKDAPQTWVAAALCVLGVGALELWNPDIAVSDALMSPQVGVGDALALVQAGGFGAQIFLAERMMRREPNQALPITATLIATTAFVSMLWCFFDGWMGQPGWETYTLPRMMLEPSLTKVAAAVAWTGIVSTSLNFFVEMSALGRVPSAEASVILATEPLWAALFAAVMLGESFGINDYVGGCLIVLACLVNTLQPSDFTKWLPQSQKTENDSMLEATSTDITQRDAEYMARTQTTNLLATYLTPSGFQNSTAMQSFQ